MFGILLLNLFLPALLATPFERDGKIIGGTTAKRNAYPYQVAILRSGGAMYCGGSILNANYVLTAAHCEMGDVRKFKVVAGAHSYINYKETGQERAIEKFTAHQNWNKDAGDGHDIAVIKVITAFILNQFVVPINLSSQGKYPEGAVIATGWGLTKDGDNNSVPEFLQVVTLAMVTFHDCSKAWGGLPKDVVCASLPGKDTCQGDSGGPLVQNVNGQFVQIGITSFGEKCASKVYPGVYTEVSKYTKWIHDAQA